MKRGRKVHGHDWEEAELPGATRVRYCLHTDCERGKPDGWQEFRGGAWRPLSKQTRVTVRVLAAATMAEFIHRLMTNPEAIKEIRQEIDNVNALFSGALEAARGKPSP